MDEILIGIVLKPQGITGEVKIKDLSDGFEAIKNVKTVMIDGKAYKVLSVRASDGFVFMRFSGLADRDGAELLRGKELYANKSEIEKSEDSYFISDVIGCKLYLSSGKELGEITDVISSSVDLYYVNTNEGLAVFPMIKKLNPLFEVEDKRITIDAKAFTEVVMYEN